MQDLAPATIFDKILQKQVTHTHHTTPHTLDTPHIHGPL